MNMCSVRQRPMPSAPNSRARRASSGVSAFVRTPSVRSSSAQPSTVSNWSDTSGSSSGTSSAVTTPALPSIAIMSPSLSFVPFTLSVRACRSMSSALRPGHARLAHPARHERRVARLAALGGEDALRGVEAGHVVGLREGAHEDHVAAVLGGAHGVVGGEDDRALRGARRRGHALGQHVEVGAGLEARVQQRVEPVRVDGGDRACAVEQPLLHGVDREPHRRLRRPLRVAGLEHVEAALLHRELRVLHVGVVLLQRAQDVHEVAVGLRHRLPHVVQVVRVAHARHDVLALCVRQEVPRRRGLARDLVAREGDARARAVALVAEHHLLHVHRRAPVVRDVVDAAVLDRALPGPGVEHGRDRLAQLLLRVLRERLAGLLLEELLEALRERPQVVDVELHVLRHAGVGLLLLDQVLVALAGDVAADVPEHLREAPVGVPGEALVVRGPGEALDGLVVEAQVQDRVEHPGHRLARAAAHGHEQRVSRVAQPACRPAPRAARARRRSRRPAPRRHSCRRRTPRS